MTATWRSSRSTRRPTSCATPSAAASRCCSVQPGTVVELSTEDCFGGRVRSVDDLPSQVCEFPYLNPVTGPIHVEGAEPGDTLARALRRDRPARDWAVSTTFPHFGALTATHSTAMLHDPLEEVVWVLRGRPASAAPACSRPRRGGPEVELPLDPMHGTVGVAPAAGEVSHAITPAAHGGNMDTPEMRAGVDGVLRGQRARARSSPSATGTAGRARARSAAPRSRPR